jgi:hypothetical protein
MGWSRELVSWLLKISSLQTFVVKVRLKLPFRA